MSDELLALNHIRSGELHSLAWKAHDEFNNVADYIWKSPRLIEHEAELERKKLDIYFKDRPDLAKLRWQHESHKLTSVFPYLIAVGNLITVMSLLEIYLLLLQTQLKKHVSIPEPSLKGQGTSRWLGYLKAIGIDVSSIARHEQVQTASRIRNCLVHAAGVLSNSRNEKELRQIQSTKVYVAPEHRKSENENELLRIVTTQLGDRLQITNDYSHVSSSYARDYFIGICKAIDDKYPSIP
jgi:hypothetical protein